MSLRDLSSLGKIMLVCSDPCDEVEKCLLSAGCWVVKVKDGETAVSQARRDIVDAVVLVSTGKGMDLAETVFNLRDISRSMQIIIVADQSGVAQSPVPRETLARLTPNTQVLTMAELATQLAQLEGSGRPKIGQRH